jgi:uncharacterized protein (TIGR00288 family)
MAPGVALLIDTENLLKGYGFCRDQPSEPSPQQILDTIKKVTAAEGTALRRAYANWRNYRLRKLGEAFDRAGIQQVQIFGGGFDPRKNAADIQLAIDAVELVHTHPSLHTFVIVSGDGGFAGLAVKLREHGKRVIGCGYKGSSSRTFQGVCDEFILIEEPQKIAA